MDGGNGKKMTFTCPSTLLEKNYVMDLHNSPIIMFEVSNLGNFHFGYGGLSFITRNYDFCMEQPRLGLDCKFWRYLTRLMAKR